MSEQKYKAAQQTARSQEARELKEGIFTKREGKPPRINWAFVIKNLRRIIVLLGLILDTFED